jgi:hypothetical protein
MEDQTGPSATSDANQSFYNAVIAAVRSVGIWHFEFRFGPWAQSYYDKRYWRCRQCLYIYWSTGMHRGGDTKQYEMFALSVVQAW